MTYDKAASDRYRAKHGDELRTRQQKFRDEHPGYKDRYAMRWHAKKLGLDPDDIERRWDAHSGLCDCCGQKCPSGRRLAMDHDHATGAFRGFLCMRCNVLLGHAQDDPERLLAAIAYLSKASCT